MNLAPTSLVAILCLLAPLHLRAAAGPKKIHLRNETLSTVAAPLTAPAPAAAPGNAEAGARSGLFLVQFTGPMQPDWSATLQALGVELAQYVPDDAFVAHFRNVSPSRVRSLPFIHWVGDYRAEHKIHSRLQTRLQRQPAQEAEVSVLVAPGATLGEIADVRRALRGSVRLSRTRLGLVWRGLASGPRVTQLAQSSAVLWIEGGAKMKLNDEIASKIVAGDAGPGSLWTQSFGLDGTGVSVAVADSGLNNGDAASMHPDLFGRVDAFFYYGSLTDAADEHSHGTHVTGIIAGNAQGAEVDEEGYLYGLGVAPGAHIVVQRIFDGAGEYEPPPTYETLTRDAVRAGADIGSNSWGDDTAGGYDLSAAEFDALVRDADALTEGDQQYILEFSAGNAGPGQQTVGSPAVGKNVIATGASENNRFDFFIYADGQEAMADFSSRGPCEDGRIKPDLVAPGTWIASLKSASASDENAWAPISDLYLYQGGTSQAGPHASGAAAVFVQYYRDLLTGVKPSPALVKAALINSAVDMDDEFGTTPVPNNDEGWGRIDLTEMILSDRTFEFIDQTNLLQTGQTFVYRVLVADTNSPLKITLAYTDVPGFPGALPALVNDLDLEVIGPDGSFYRGNQFSEGESVPFAGSGDRVNNVEGVHLSQPLAGDYVVSVRAQNVVQDARRDTPSPDQDFALVISGSLAPPGAGVVAFDRFAYAAPAVMGIKVIDTDLAGQPSVGIDLFSSFETTPERITLFAAGNTGAFTNSVRTVTTAPASDGRISVRHGDTITAHYFDASFTVTRAATAGADLIPPVISGLSVASAFGKMLIRWNTDEAANAVVRYGLTPSLAAAATNRAFEVAHEVGLSDLIPGRTYYFAVVSSDLAGNTSTNNGSTFVAVGAPTVLLVNDFEDDGFDLGPYFPLSSYTDALNAAGVAYDLWDIEDGAASPTVNDLRPYRAVIWRFTDNVFLTTSTLTAAEESAVKQYVEGGGGFLLAGMEQLSRLTVNFKRDVLQVAAFAEDATVPSIAGVPGNPITAGLNSSLDYSEFYTDSYELFGVPSDVSDTMTLTTNAAPIFTSLGAVAGMMFPKPGLDRPGRVVFLSFPLEAVSTSAAAPNNRATLLKRILDYLAPGEGGVGVVTLNNNEFTVPSLVTIEVADSDLQAAGTVDVRITSTSEPAGKTVTLRETVRRGVFRGTVALVPVLSQSGPGQLRAAPGDTIRTTYVDASAGRNVEATATIETTPPVISFVESEPDYVEAYVTWETSEPADSLVQFGESTFLGRSAFDGSLTTSHEVFLTGLQPDRDYNFKVVSRDNAGNVTEDDNGGNFYTFRTLRPVTPPWTDDFEHGNTNWVVLSADETEVEWQLGVPNNSSGETAHSPVTAWGSNLNGEYIGQAESYLISPPIALTGGNKATLRFWDNYDFSELEGDIFEYGEVVIITNVASAPIPLLEVNDFSGGWEENEINLTPYLGQVVYVAWHYVQFSIDNHPRPGWLVDDVSVVISHIQPGTILITNNLAQSLFVLSGPVSQSGRGWGITLTNAPPGQYQVQFGGVPYYTAPTGQTHLLVSGQTVIFTGNYSFPDANANGMSDVWEQAYFGEISPGRTPATDSDGDGMTDFGEFAAGTHPGQPGSRLALQTPETLSDGSVQMRWPSVNGRAYRIEGSADAVTWNAASDWIIATGISTTFRLPAIAPGGPFLFRLEVRP